MFHFVIKKGKGPWDWIPFFFQWFRQFFKYLNSNHNTLSYLLFSKYFSWFLYLVVQRGTGVFRVFFFFHSSSRAWLALHSRFTLASVWPKNAEKMPVLQIQASSVKIRVRGFLFLVSLHIKTDGKTNFFLLRHQHVDKEVFEGVIRE